MLQETSVLSQFRANWLSALLAGGLIFIPLLYSATFVDPFVDPKWIGLHLIALAIAGVLFSRRSPFPQLSKFPSLFLLGGLLGLHCLLKSPISGWVPALRMLTVAIFFLGAGQLFRGGKNLGPFLECSVLAMTLVSAIGLWQVLLPKTLPFSLLTGHIDSTFGYPNITAEYLGLAVLTSLHLFLTCDRRSRFTGFLVGGIALTGAYLIFLSCRAVGVGLLVSALMYSHLLRKGGTRAKGNSRFLPFLFLGVCFGLVLIVITPDLREKWSPSFRAAKMSNIDLRWQRWKNTLRMIEENPLGVGLGRFGFAYFDYHGGNDSEVTRGSFVDSSHNFWLDTVAELGIPLSALLFLSLFQFLRLGFRACRDFPQDRALFAAAIVYVFILGLVCFPWRNPALCLQMSVLAAWVFRRRFSENNAASHLHWGLIPLLAYQVVGYAATSHVALRPSHHYALASGLAQWFPFSLENRFALARFECVLEEMKRCESTALAILRSEPNYLWAYEPLGESYAQRREKVKACAAGAHLARLDHAWFKARPVDCEAL